MFRCMAGVVRGSEEGPAKFTTHPGIVSASYQKSKKIVLPPRSSRQKRAVLRDLTVRTCTLRVSDDDKPNLSLHAVHQPTVLP
jgi:hypothetical protein